MIDIQELIERWNSDEGKPYKGSLIDRDSYSEGNLSCMCAQGQVLHIVGGWDADRLFNAEQADADKETAKLLNISRAHSILLRNTNDMMDGAPAIVLTNPRDVLGDQWSKLLDFWWHMDGLDYGAWKKVGAAWAAARDAAWAAAGDAAGDAAGAAARDAAWAAARDAAWAAARDAAWGTARDAARDAAWAAARDAAWGTAWEIQGAATFERDSIPFFFLPLFGFASPDDIPERPSDYGVTDDD